MPDYDLNALKVGLGQIEQNIAQIEQALQNERARRDQYMRLIFAQEAEQTVMAQLPNGASPCRKTGGEHKWVVDRQFPDRSWQERHCEECGDVQRLGVD